MTTRTEQVAVPGGGYDLTVWLPESGTGPGVLLLQEIFGVGAYLHAVAADLTRMGYVVAFGGRDPYIPRADVTKVEEAVAGRPKMEIHVEEQAGHAYHNREAPMFYDPEPAARAWRRTEDFLGRHLPVR
jgi:dienelactone hydrolase